MIIGHLPAGYILSTLCFPRIASQGVSRNKFMRAGLLGAIAPDLDLIYFYGIDDRAHLHHTYFSHFPVVWLVLLISVSLWCYAAKRKELPLLATIFAANGLLHMLLDFIAGNIYWLAPWVMQPFSLFTVSRIFEPWWLNFLFHRSFLLEIAIVVWAVFLWRKTDELMLFKFGFIKALKYIMLGKAVRCRR